MTYGRRQFLRNSGAVLGVTALGTDAGKGLGDRAEAGKRRGEWRAVQL